MPSNQHDYDEAAWTAATTKLDEALGELWLAGGSKADIEAQLSLALRSVPSA